MNRDDRNPLARWLTKAKDLPAPPASDERRGREPRTKSNFRQLNLKVSERTYARFKKLAYRDRRSGVGILEVMLDVYEKEHGALDK